MAIPRPSGPDRYQWRCSPVQVAEYCAQLERFVRLHGNDMARLREHLDSGECDLACDVARNVRGIAQLIGARRVALRTAELLRVIRSGAERASILSLADACEAEFEHLLETVRRQPLPAARS